MRSRSSEVNGPGLLLVRAVFMLVAIGGNEVTPAAWPETSGDQASSHGDVAGFSVEMAADRLGIHYSRQPVAEFVFGDERILRPYFSMVHSPRGLQLTRNHPPVPGTDATDHDTMHPGIWLAMGDVSGHDFWRNQGRIEHLLFSQPPVAKGNQLSFATNSRLVAPDGQVVCHLASEFDLCMGTGDWLLVWDATFRSDEQDFSFGDQEEMGLGVRVATPFTEIHGGEIRNSDGQRTAAETWGQPAKWCDYSGTSGPGRGGVTLIPDPTNFRGSWWHSRDYGLLVANPFGREAMRQGPPSRVTVKRGEPFRVRFAAVLHDGDDYDPAERFEQVMKWFKVQEISD